jgi:hypothetical protein
LAAICIAVSFLAFRAPGASALTSGFTDITGSWAEAVIDRWWDYGVLTLPETPPAPKQSPSGNVGRRGVSPPPSEESDVDTRFRPNDFITRGELALIISNMMKYKTTSTTGFYDLNSDALPQEQVDALKKCVAAGVMQGSYGYIRPLAPVTREEAAVMVGRAMEITPSDSPFASFRDQSEISGWAKNMVLTLKELGFVSGRSEGYFSPKQQMTRAEAVKMLDNIIVNGLYYKTGVYTISSMGNVIINTDNVEIRGATITGDLIISEGVGESGKVTLTDVTVNGSVYIRGGKEIILNGQTRLGDIRQLKVKDTVTVTGGVSGIIEKITVAPGSGPMTFTGAIRELNVTAANNTFKLNGAVVMNATFDAYNSNLVMDPTSYVSNMEVKQPVIVTGRGRISNVNIDGGASGSSFEIHPNKVTVPTATKVFLASNEYNNDSGGSKTYNLPTDSRPPEMGNMALLATNIKEDRMTITWKPASDNTTVRNNLRYMLYYSADKYGMDTVEGLEQNATPANSVYTANLLTMEVTRLKTDTKYYFNVIVMDEYGNKSCYTPLNMGLEGDNDAPTIWSSTLDVEKLSDSDYKLSWQKARDVNDVTPQEYLKYTLYETDRDDLITVYDWLESGKVVESGLDITSFTVKPAKNKQLRYTVVVQDNAGNAVRYELKVFGIDEKDPVAGSAPKVTAHTNSQLKTLSWGAASDTDGGSFGTPSHLLMYYVYHIEQGASTTLEDIRKDGYLERSGMALTSTDVVAPGEGKTFIYAVIVQDEVGNMKLYPLSEAVKGPDPPPSPSPSP